ETGLGNILVTLVGLDAAGNPMLLTTTTAADGSYLFDGLPAATFTLTFGDLPLDYVFSPANVGNDATDSDVISADGSTGSISIGLNESRLTIDAGLFNACDNITFPGTIAGDEYLCGPGNDPGPIVEVLPASGGSGPIEYMWMMSTQGGPFNANTWTPIPNSNTPNYNPGPIAVTTYYARCVRRDGCTLFLEGNIVVKEVGSEAVAVINGPATICVDDIVTFSADDSGAGATYNWNFGQNASPPTASTQSVDVSWSLYGVQTITLSATNNGCTSTASMQVYVTNSPNWCDQNLQGSDRSSTKEALGQVRLFPNPTADLLNVQLPPDLEGPVRLELFSTTGQRLQTFFLEGPATETLDLSTLQPGLYLLNCTFANAEPQMLRVMKQGE
ncbi:MAG: T9SS type A sorting domain-containing protein, partial [Saprospiraceae bacterium]|nr:T9SS type A sorting domain-containing protein [Saprospiraceae bacterium]